MSLCFAYFPIVSEPSLAVEPHSMHESAALAWMVVGGLSLSGYADDRGFLAGLYRPNHSANILPSFFLLCASGLITTGGMLLEATAAQFTHEIFLEFPTVLRNKSGSHASRTDSHSTGLYRSPIHRKKAASAT